MKYFTKTMMIFLVIGLLCHNINTYGQIVTNLLVNGDFETGTGEMPDNWSTFAYKSGISTFAWGDGLGYDNTRGISVSSDPSQPNDAGYSQQINGLIPGQTYNIRGWIKGENIVTENNVGANLSILGGFIKSSEQLIGTFDWTQAVFSFTAESESVEIVCRLGFYGNLTTGKAWFDNVVLEEPYLIVNGNFEAGTGEVPDYWSTFAYKSGISTFEWGDGLGYNNTRGISVSSDPSQPNDAGYSQQINGLIPGQTYNIRGWIKGENIVTENNVGANLSILGGFIKSSEQLIGTFDWTQAVFSFTAESESVEIVCRLGFYGNLTSGKAWFDNVVIEEPYLFYDSEHISLSIESGDKASITDENLDIWIGHLNMAYEKYEDLVGFAPFDKIGILSVRQYPGGWAVAGNPIKWHQPYVAPELASINADNENYSFGIIHEISHDFDANSWNFAAEFFANFKMYYAIEQLNATVYLNKPTSNTRYQGLQIDDFWKLRYDEEKEYLEQTGRYKTYQGALVYRFIQIAKTIGWEPFKLTFRDLLKLPYADIPTSNAAKFILFLDKLTEYSGTNVRGLIAPDELNDFIVFLDPDFSLCSGDIILTSQAEVDAFDCTEVQGDLTISGDDITNLDGLSNLTFVNGNLNIQDNPLLISIEGLGSLSAIGSDKRLTIGNNQSITNLNGLSSLNSIYSFRITNNDELISLNALSTLVSCWFLVINNNDKLPNLNGLSSLSDLGGIQIINNALLTNIDGLSSINETQASINISDNPVLQNLNGLSSLTIINRGLIIENNSSLLNLDGLSSLTSVGSYPLFNRFLNINSNASLTNLNGLSSLTEIGGDLEVMDNTSLASCCGLFSVLNISGVGGVISISGNAAGCTESDIIANGPCAQSCNGDIILSSQAEVDAFDCTEVGGDLVISGDNITNVDGLSELTFIGHSLIIENNPLLINIDGLSNLLEIGGADDVYSGYNYLKISNNTSLISIQGLASSSVEGSIGISDNSALLNLDGIPFSFTSSKGGHQLIITNNDALLNVDGLYFLTNFSGYFASIKIIDNDALKNLDGLSSLESITSGFLSSTLVISENDNLTNLNGLYSLISLSGKEHPGNLIITNNVSLSSCCGIFPLLEKGGVLPFSDISGNGAGCTVENIQAGGPCSTICDGDILLTSQAEVDAFDCTEVGGDLTISGDDIANVDGLSELTVVGHSLIIENNPLLINIDGLSNLLEIGGANDVYSGYNYLKVSNNTSLVSIQGLASSSVEGNIEISDNNALLNLDGIPPSSTSSKGGHSLKISNNDALLDIDGLNFLTAFSGFSASIMIVDNDELINIDGLSSLTSIFGFGTSSYLTISENDKLTNINGLASLTQLSGNASLGSLTITNNILLASCCGLFPLLEGGAFLTTANISGNGSGCTQEEIIAGGACPLDCSRDVVLSSQAEVDAFDCLEILGDLTISGNDITNLDALENIEAVNGHIFIKNNPQLLYIDGFNKLKKVDLGISIYNNADLRTINGFQALDSLIFTDWHAEGFSIHDNPFLFEIKGFSSLVYIYCPGPFTFSISNNNSLNTIEGFSLLNKIAASPALDVSIVNNDYLQNLYGFKSLTALTGLNVKLTISDNASLKNIDGLGALILVGGARSGALYITDNPQLERCCGIFPLLDSGTLGIVSLSGNGAGCTEADILASGLCDPCDGDIFLSSQAEVDAFNCLEITGDLTISGNDITNLDALNNLESIQGSIIIKNNPTLLLIDGFSSVKEVGGGIKITDNHLLEVIDGFNILEVFASGGSFPTNFEVTSNASLQRIEGFSMLTEIYSNSPVVFNISNNISLASIKAFSSLISIKSESATTILIFDNPLLIDLSGLNKLEEILGAFSCELKIINNDALLDLNSFSSLTTFNSLNVYLNISENNALKNVDALSSLNIFGVRPGRLIVKNNINLMRCCGLYYILSRIPGPPTYDVSGNGAGCTFEDIIAEGPCLEFEADRLTLCTSEDVIYTITSTLPATNLEWNFGEGAIPQTSIGFGPHTVVYNTSGEKTIILESDGSFLISKTNYITVNQSPADKYVFPEIKEGCDQLGTNILVRDYEEDIMYQLRRESDNQLRSGPWPGFIGLYSGELTETTSFIVEAINTDNGCVKIMTIKPVVTINSSPLDKYVLAEYPSGPSGHNTNILVMDHQPDVLYRLRNDVDNSDVAGPWPGTVGLFTGPLYETTTFNVLAYDPLTWCETEMSKKVTVTINNETASTKSTTARISQGIDEEAQDELLNPFIRVYPNPTNGNFELEMQNQMEGTYQVIIYNLSGKILLNEFEVMKGSLNRQKYDLSELPEGIYYFTVVFDDNVVKQEVIMIMH